MVVFVTAIVTAIVLLFMNGSPYFPCGMVWTTPTPLCGTKRLP